VVLLLHSVSDFSIACKNQSTNDLLCDTLDSHWDEPMTQHGIMQHFSGVDAVQAGDHITLHIETYLKGVFQSYGSISSHKSIQWFVQFLDKATPLSTD